MKVSEYLRLAARQAQQNYYAAKDHTPIKLIIRLWREGKKILDTSMPVMYRPDEIWKYREYDWSRETARGGRARVKGKMVELPGPLKWDAMVEDMRAQGWDKDDPAHMDISHKRAMVGEGNHRLAIAREANILVPVEFHFRIGKLSMPARAKKRQQEEAELPKRLNAPAIEKAVKEIDEKELSPEEEKQVQDLMDLLGF